MGLLPGATAPFYAVFHKKSKKKQKNQKKHLPSSKI
jgi:hypothetical protein